MDNNAPQSVEELEERLSRPSERVVETLSRLPGDLIVLGVGGKMGPTLARMAKRALTETGPKRRVVAVSRFSESKLREQLEGWGIETVQGDLLDESFVESLPDVPNVVYMAGFKFGASENPSLTWAMNCLAPALVCQKFSSSRIAAFSTGNVYGMTSTAGKGSKESDELNPIGEYAMAALGRERIFEHFSRTQDTRTVLLRLNYACEMRYGVLVDLAQQVQDGQPIDVSMGYFNGIWQADANAMALQSLALATNPPQLINIVGPEQLSVKKVCETFGRHLNRSVSFVDIESEEALLSNGELGYQTLERPSVAADELIAWTADWIERGGPTLSKPTKFQSRDGRF